MDIIKFENLNNADLIIDTVYKGGTAKNKSSEVLSKLLPGCSNSGGFRKVLRKDGSNLPAYVVLYTSMSELEWPDYLDEETGVFRYYGDNRTPGRHLLDTPRKGNLLLEKVFNSLNKGEMEQVPPFLIFKKGTTGFDVQFLGLAAPGHPKISPDKDLVAFWRTMNQQRFQNYEAYFTVLNTNEPISKEWLNSLVYDHDNNLKFAPIAWKKYIQKGRNGISPLTSKRILKVPSKYDQLQSDSEGTKCVEIIRNFYRDNPYGFEMCAKTLLEMSDENFSDFVLTRPWRDGGRDAVGFYVIGAESISNYPLKIDCAMEAKCYSASKSVGVREMSRLISRIKYRQFGVMVTTSYVNQQAYKEIIEDGHPILVISASEIGGILRKNAISSNNIYDWLRAIDEKDIRFGI